MASHTQNEIGSPVAAGTDTLFSEMTPPIVPDRVFALVTIAWADNHCVLLIFDLQSRTVFVRDGLSYPLDTWSRQIANILRIYQLQENDQRWTTELADQTWLLHQTDNVNCGPIACFQLYGLFLPFAATRRIRVDNFAVPQLRKLILNVFRSLIRLSADSISHWEVQVQPDSTDEEGRYQGSGNDTASTEDETSTSDIDSESDAISTTNASDIAAALPTEEVSTTAASVTMRAIATTTNFRGREARG